MSDNITGSGALANWACGEAEVMEQLRHEPLTKEDFDRLNTAAVALHDDVDSLYSRAFVKELNDMRMDLKSLLRSMEKLKLRFNGN